MWTFVDWKIDENRPEVRFLCWCDSLLGFMLLLKLAVCKFLSGHS